MFRTVSRKTIVQSSIIILLAVALLTLALVYLLPSAPQEVFAAEPAVPATFISSDNGLNSTVDATWVSCIPASVATFEDRVHVECAASIAGIRFFAAPTNNPAHAARVLSTLSAAQVAGRTLSILYDPSDTSGSKFNCQESDCRTIIAVGFGQ